jgi:hypothetical protein
LQSILNMGVGVEHVDRKLSVDATYVSPGNCCMEGINGQKTRIVVFSSLEGDRGTVFVAGNVRNVNFKLFEDELDYVGHTVKPDSIEVSGKVGVFVPVTWEEELKIFINRKRRQAPKVISVFICDSARSLEEKLLG